MPVYPGDKRSVRRNGRTRIVIRAVCDCCNRERWILKENIRPGRFTGLCASCANKRYGENSSAYKNGRLNHSGGYVLVLVQPDDDFASMRDVRGYVYEHRYVMAKKLGRPLKSTEQVHHLNGDKKDNRPENLALVNRHEHLLITKLEARIRELEEALEAQNALSS